MESRRTLAAPERMENVFACPAEVSFRRSPGALCDIFRINLAHDLCSSFCDAPDSSLWWLRLKTKYGMSLKPSISRATLEPVGYKSRDDRHLVRCAPGRRRSGSGYLTLSEAIHLFSTTLLDRSTAEGKIDRLA